MLVKATQRGYYGTIVREEGHVFALKPYETTIEEKAKDKNGKEILKKVKKIVSAEDQFADMWMEKVEDAKSAKFQKRSGGAVGARPAPEAEEELAARIAAAEELEEESRAEDAKVL